MSRNLETSSLCTLKRENYSRAGSQIYRANYNTARVAVIFELKRMNNLEKEKETWQQLILSEKT